MMSDNLPPGTRVRDLEDDLHWCDLTHVDRDYDETVAAERERSGDETAPLEMKPL